MLTPLHRSRARLARAGMLLLLAACGADPADPASVGRVASITILGGGNAIRARDTLRLAARAADVAGNPVTVQVTWRSSDTSVAKVDASGLATAVAVGQATIHAAAAGREGTLAVLVIPPTVADIPAPAPTASSTIILSENYDRFNGVRRGDGDPYLASIYPVGGRPSLVTGRGGSGKAIRFPYSPADTGNSIESYLAGPETNLYVSYWFRTSPGADPTAGGRNPSGIKWFVAWRSDDGIQPRYTMGVGNLTGGPVGSTNSGLEFSSHDQGSQAQPNPFMQNVRKGIKFGTVNDGQWHRYTVHFVTTTDGSTRTGYEQIWIDGQLVLDNQGYGYDHDVRGIRILAFPNNVVPAVPAGWEFTIDVDDLVAWRN